MKIFTIYSESHKVWYDVLRASLFAHCSGFELHSRFAPQVCKTGEYGSDDVMKFWYLKIGYILELLNRETEPLLYTDCDVYFFRDFKSDLEERLNGKDILFQFEKRFLFYKMVCAGFMYIRPNEKVKIMFQWILDNMDQYGNDQKTLNRYLLKRKISYGVLPKTYYSINYDNGNKVWNGEDVNIKVKNPFMAHIHWCIGLEKRLKLLEKIKSYYKWTC